MVDDTTLGSVVLGLDGSALRGAELVDCEVWLHAETTATRTGCPVCGVVAAAHDRRVVQLRDLPVTGRPTRLVWCKRPGGVSSRPAPRRRGRNGVMTSSARGI